MSPVPSSLCSVGATLGEGPVWDERTGKLWFVDIKEQRVHRFDPEQGVLRSWKAPNQVGWVLPDDAGTLVAGLKSGLHRFDPAQGLFTPLVDPEPDAPGNRLNDATVDREGGIWFGTMDDSEQDASGHVYRYAEGKALRIDLDPVVITNGPAFSPDGRTLYHVDTLGKTIWAIAAGDGAHVGAARQFARIEDGAGYPDGPAVDAEGHVWIGLFGGWGARRYAPDGRLVATVAFPVANVTKIAFGGDGLRTAFATTARKGLSEEALAEQPLAGDLFTFDPGVSGLPIPPARISRR
ncbi:SMP-30/gluconolactonase/LRE family protein [Sphingomonas oryzagri]